MDSEQPESEITQPDLVGSAVGRFSVSARLGSGGMGEVYRAEDRQLQRTVAIKRLSRRDRTAGRNRSELLKEAQRASALNHPRIAGVYDVVVDGSEMFLVMEYVDGMTLRQRLQSHLDLPEFLEIAVQCADGLAAAHEKHILHGDLKPENIMLTRPKNEVKLCDFGLARRVSDFSHTDTQSTVREGFAGTPAYMAPEAAEQKPLDVRADIFSLGVVFYEMLAGSNPFRGESLIMTLDRIRELSPKPLDRVNPSVPPGLARVVARMLEKDSSRRYSNAAELLADLSKVKLEAQKTRTPRAFSAPKWIGIGLSILLLTAAVWTLLQYQPAPVSARLPLPEALNLTMIPFSVIGVDAGKQFFSEGLNETLSTQLSRLTVGREFQVFTAAEARTRGVRTPREAREHFGSNVALSGSLQYSAGQVRINLLLSNTASGRALRTETVTGNLADSFAVQDRVAEAAVRMLELELKPEEGDAISRHGTQQPGAYDFYLQGRGYLLNFDRSENIESAIAVFRKALEIDPRYALAYSGLGEAYWRKHESTKSTVWVEPARAACEGALAIDPNIAEPHACLGMVLNGTGNYETAVEQFHLAIRREPTNDLFYVGLANAYEKLGRPADAEKTYRLAIDSRPHYWATYSALAAYFYRVGRHDDAAGMFQQVIALAPDSFRGYSNLGAVQFMKDQIPEAIASFEKSLSIRPNYQAASNLGTLYYFDGQYERSAAAFRQAISLNQNDEQVWANLGGALRWAKRPEESADAYRQAKQLAEEKLRVNPRSAAAQIAIAVYTAALGDDAKGLSLIREALKLKPTEPRTLFRVAVFFEELGQRDEALIWLKKAVENGQSWREVNHSPSLRNLRQDPRFLQFRRVED